MKKSILIMVLIFLLMLSFTACGDDEKQKEGYAGNSKTEKEAKAELGLVESSDVETENGENISEEKSDIYSPEGFYMGEKGAVKIGLPEKPLNPQEVYDNLVYTPQMFYGRYRILGGDEAKAKLRDESEYIEITENGKKRQITQLPCSMEIGRENLSLVITHVKEHNWMRMGCYQKLDGVDYYYDLVCAYEIEGNILKLKILDTFEYDQENHKITYAFAEDSLQYEFSFCGRNLTLSTGGQSVTLTAGLDVYEDNTYFYADNFLSPGSMAIEGIDRIHFRYEEEDMHYNRFQPIGVDNRTIQNAACILEENGLCTFAIPWEDGVKIYQYVYFYGNNDGLVLTDGVNTYYYNDTYTDRHKQNLSDYLTEDQTAVLNDLAENKLEALAEKKDDLLEELEKAFREVGISVTINAETGEMAMDSSILFGGDSSDLTAEGKEFLNKFINAYTSILYSEKYDGFVSKTIVEGHTAPLASSTYESGLPLSEERANMVKEYCSSAEIGIDTTRLAEELDAIGYSNSRPIYDEAGDVDLEASRRVSFRFIINLDFLQ